MLLVYSIILWAFQGVLCQELTIQKIIETRKDLAQTSKYLTPTNIMTILGNSNFKNTTFFAPNNNAFDHLPHFSRNQLDGTPNNQMQQFFEYHLVPGEIWVPEMMNGKEKMKLGTRREATKLFINKIKDRIFVNNAEVVEANLLALNGRCHVIDRFLAFQGLNLNAPSGLTAYEYLKSIDSEMYSIFKTYEDYTISSSIIPHAKYGSAVKDYIRNPEAHCTLFVPDDDFIRKFRTSDQDVLSKISGLSPGLMKTVIDSLVVPNYAYHVRLLLDLSANKIQLKAIKGSIHVYSLMGNVYVVNQCGQARIRSSDHTTDNCVVHFIDNFLGLINNNTFFTIISMYDLSDFHRTMHTLPSDIKHILKPDLGFETILNQSEKVTIFAPTNGVFRKVDFARDVDRKREQLQMIMVKGVIDLSQLQGPMRVETMRPGYYANIHKKGEDIFVEVNNVRARVVEASICTLNGMIHKVDRILGVPDSNIQKYLDQDQYRKMYTILEDTGLMTSLINPTNRLTLFAVNQSAIDKMSPMYLGQQNKNKLRDLIARHVGNTVLFLDSITIGQSFRYETFNGYVSVTNENGVYWVEADGEKVKVLEGNMRMENGVIHVLSDFLPYQISSADITNGHNYQNIFLNLLLIKVFVLNLFRF